MLTSYTIRLRSCFFVAVLFLLSCSKQAVNNPDPLAKNIIALTGSEGAYSRWRLNKIMMNRVEQPQNTVNKEYYKAYLLNGTFEDGDGLRGKWKMVTTDSLREVVTNTMTGAYAIQTYQITNLTRTELSLRYLVNAKEVSISFTAEK